MQQFTNMEKGGRSNARPDGSYENGRLFKVILVSVCGNAHRHTLDMPRYNADSALACAYSLLSNCEETCVGRSGQVRSGQSGLTHTGTMDHTMPVTHARNHNNENIHRPGATDCA